MISLRTIIAAAVDRFATRAIYRAGIDARRELAGMPDDSDDPGVDVDLGVPDFTTRERGWMQTASGRRFYPLAPRAEDVDIGDIATALSNLCRFNGHVTHFYSVAEHSVHVSREVERRMRNSEDLLGWSEAAILHWSLAALLHDAAEAYIGDMVRPLKHQPEMGAFRAAELGIQNAVLRAVGSDCPDKVAAWRLIKEIDDRILADEGKALKQGETWWSSIKPLGVKIECWGPEWARERFMLRYDGLKRAIADLK